MKLILEVDLEDRRSLGEAIEAVVNIIELLPGVYEAGADTHSFFEYTPSSYVVLAEDIRRKVGSEPFGGDEEVLARLVLVKGDFDKKVYGRPIGANVLSVEDHPYGFTIK